MRFLIIITLHLVLLFSCVENKLRATNDYLKKEVYIEMRDGVRLFTSIYIPMDTSRTYPILLQRTPYSSAPYGEENFRTNLGPSEYISNSGYIFVYQDVRGKFMSEGSYKNMRPYIANKQDSIQIDESSDTYDTIDWLTRNIPANNGNVGMWGISYPGFYAAMGMIDAHPALKAVSPQAPIADWFIGDDMHHNGAFSLTLAFNFFSSFGQERDGLVTKWPVRFKHGTPDGYDFFLKLGALPNANKKYFHHSIPFWDDLMEHGTYDSFWQARNILPHLNNIQPAVLVVGGWFDAEDLYGPLHIFARLDARNQHLIMGPWSHGGWARSRGESIGDVSFGSATSEYYQTEIEFPFFNHYLKDGPDFSISAVHTFDTGSLQWHAFDEWPPAETQQTEIFLSSNNRLEFSPPAYSSDFETYISDPAHPVPFINKITNTWDRTYMTADQRFASMRPDVVTFQSDILDGALTFSGPLTADIFVSTSGTDSDWIVKLIDVYPDSITTLSEQAGKTPLGGYQQLVRGEIIRAKFRNSYEYPQPMIPGQVTEIKIPLQDVFHTFKKGHRIMVQVQSSWFPLFDRNPQKFTDIYQTGDADFQSAEQRIYHAKAYPSRLIYHKLQL